MLTVPSSAGAISFPARPALPPHGTLSIADPAAASNRRPVGRLDSLKAAAALRIGNRFLDRGAVPVPAFVHCRHLHTTRKAVKAHQTVALSRRSAGASPGAFRFSQAVRPFCRTSLREA